MILQMAEMVRSVLNCLILKLLTIWYLPSGRDGMGWPIMLNVHLPFWNIGGFGAHRLEAGSSQTNH